jgi:hypothetical protein
MSISFPKAGVVESRYYAQQNFNREERFHLFSVTYPELKRCRLAQRRNLYQLRQFAEQVTRREPERADRLGPQLLADGCRGRRSRPLLKA